MPEARHLQTDARRTRPDRARAAARSQGVLGAFLFQFTTVLNEQLDKLFANDIELRRYWYPGDVKMSLRRYDPGQDLDQMPGFIPWVPGLVLSKAAYPALYAAIGSANPNDNDTETTFTLRDHQSGYIRVAGISESPTTIEGVLDSGSGVDGVVLSAWLKT